jgi:hypothetical protein
MAANIETGERQSAGGAIGSDDRINEQIRVAFEEFLRPSTQPKPTGALHEVLAEIAGHLKKGSLAIKTINDRLFAIENQTKKRSSRGFARYLLAICIGAAATLAWQSYGEAAKQMFATKAPAFGWSPETKHLIANWVERLGWTKPPATAESTAAQSSATETSQAAAAPSINPEQVHQIAMELTALRQTVEQIAAGQDQMAREVDRLQAADQEILVKIPTIPPPPPIAAAPAVTGRPAPGGAPPSENTQNTAPTAAKLPVGHAAIEGALRASCGPDVQRLCGRISGENGGVIKCLNSHRTQLSPICDAHLNGVPKATSPNR